MKLSSIKLNGVKLNGVKLNIIKLNGVKLKDAKLNQVKLNGVKLNPVKLNTIHRYLLFGDNMNYRTTVILFITSLLLILKRLMEVRSVLWLPRVRRLFAIDRILVRMLYHIL